MYRSQDGKRAQLIAEKRSASGERMLQDIWTAPTRSEAEAAFDLFVKTFKAKCERSVKCLQKDRNVLLTFFVFRAVNWCHIRTTNPIESTFATIRLRHRRPKDNGSARANLTMMFKPPQNASQGWRKIRCRQPVPDLVRGVKFMDGVNENHLKDEGRKSSPPRTIRTETVA